MEEHSEIKYRLFSSDSDHIAGAEEFHQAVLSFIREKKEDSFFQLDLTNLPVYVKNAFSMVKYIDHHIDSASESMTLTIKELHSVLRDPFNRFFNSTLETQAHIFKEEQSRQFQTLMIGGIKD